MDTIDIKVCNNCGCVFDYNKANREKCRLCGHENVIGYDENGKIIKDKRYYRSYELIVS